MKNFGHLQNLITANLSFIAVCEIFAMQDEFDDKKHRKRNVL